MAGARASPKASGLMFMAAVRFAGSGPGTRMRPAGRSQTIEK